MTDPRNFLLNSDYPLDMVAFKTEGSISVPNLTLSGDVTIPHGLSFAPLPLIIWSNDPAFTTSYTSGDPDFTSDFVGSSGQQYSVFSDATNVYITRFNFSGSTQTVYYRIFGFAASTEPDTIEVPPNAVDSDEFLLNSDFNYLKLAETGRLTTSSTSFTHDLGVIPTTLAWGVNYSSGTVISLADPQINAQIINGGAGSSYVYVGTSSIDWLSPATFDAIEFRIYVDEGGI